VNNLHDKATGYVDQAKATVDNAKATLQQHQENARSFHQDAKKTFCGLPGMSTVCEEDSTTPASCTGPGCCAQSSCYSNLVPGLRCDGSRGATTCVGGSILSGTQGVCQCKYNSICGASGQCPALGVEPIGLFEMGEVIPKEDFTLPLLVFFVFFAMCIMLSAIATLQRVRRGISGHRAGSIAPLMQVDEWVIEEGIDDAIE